MSSSSWIDYGGSRRLTGSDHHFHEDFFDLNCMNGKPGEGSCNSFNAYIQMEIRPAHQARGLLSIALPLSVVAASKPQGVRCYGSSSARLPALDRRFRFRVE